MKNIIYGIAAALILSVPAVQAQELETKTIPMAYFSVPFGDMQQDSAPVFGFKVTQTATDSQGGFNLFQSQRPAIFDYQMRNGESHAFTINGFNALEKTNVVYANGTSKTETTLNWKIILPAVFFGGIFLFKVTEGEGGGSDHSEVVCVAECFSF